MRLIQSGSSSARVMLIGEAPGVLLSQLPLRIQKKIAINTATGCWIWNGARGGELQHGQTWWEGRVQPVHRVIYEFFNGKIDEGLEPDHLCRVPECCNPAHIEPVTHAENVKRGTAYHHVVLHWLIASHCDRGHPFVSENIYTEPNGKRRCLTCKRARLRKHRAKKRHEAQMEDLLCIV